MLIYRVSEFSNINFIKYVTLVLTLVDFSKTLLDVENPRCVFDVGSNLTKRLTDHPSGTKEDLINDLTDYFIYLNTAFRVESQNFPKGKTMLEKLLEKGGPPFLGVEVKDKLLESKYEMGVVEVEHVKEVIEDIDRLWKDIKGQTVVPAENQNH